MVKVILNKIFKSPFVLLYKVDFMIFK